MAQNIILKKSSVLGRIPDSSDLAYGELALNYSDGKLYYKKSNNEIDFFLTDSNLDSDFITSRVSAGSLALTNSQISAVVDELTNDIKPLLDALYDIGDSVRTWKDLYLDSQGKVYFGPSNFFNLSKLNSILDSADVLAIANASSAGLDSAAANTLIDAKIQIIDIGDVVGADGNSGQILKSLGNGNATWINQADLVRPHLVAGANITYDSATGVITADLSTAGLDSAAVTGIIDSAYIQSRQADIFRDSAFVTGIVDTAYIQARDRIRDSNFVQDIVDSAYVQLRQAAPTAAQVRPFMVAGANITYDSATGVISSTASGTLDSAAVIGIIDSAYIQARDRYRDSGFVTGLIDSSYINSRVTTSTDSSTVNTLIDAKIQVIDIGDVVGADGNSGQILKSLGNGNSTWVSAADIVRPQLVAGSNITYDSATGVISSSASGVDSALTTQLIDSAYVQARQIKYSNADFADSAYVTTQINNLIDGAPGALDTLNELAAALNDDSQAYNTLLALINANTSAIAGKLDSALTTQLINAAYIQANQTHYLDSSLTTQLIDSAYVQARQTTYDFLDSAEVISLIDSAYIAARTSSGTDSAAVNTLIDAKIQVIDIGDVVGADGNSGQVLKSLGNGNSTWVNTSTFVTLDSSTLTSGFAGNIIPATDSTYDLGDSTRRWRDLYLSGNTIYLGDSAVLTAAKVNLIPSVALDSSVISSIAVTAAGGIDSALTISLIDSAYVQARQTVYLDSSTVQGVISAAYIQANQTTYSNADFADSAFVTAQINNLIDGAPGALNTLNELAAALNDDSQAYNTLLALINANTSAVAGKLDSSLTISLIDSAYIAARTTSGTDSASVNSLIDAKIQVIDIGDVVGADGNSGQLLKSLGNGNSTWVNAADIVRPQLVAGSNITYDSATGVISSSASGVDSALTTQLIDSAYVQLRQIKYSTADFVDSAYVTTQINNLIDGAPGALNTLNELAAALNDDSQAYNTLLALINANSSAVAGKLDSALTTQLINAAYIQANQTNFLDSALTVSLIDSAYVQARQTTYDFLDSAEVISLIDSAYIAARTTSGTDSASVNSLIDAKIQVIDIGDVVGADGNSGQLLKSLGNGNSTWVNAADIVRPQLVAGSNITYDSATGVISSTASGTLDSNAVIGIVDSAYIQARQADIFRDSAFVTGIVSSSYIQSNQTNFLDSALTTQLISAAYIQANQTTYSTADFPDSAYVTTQINNLIDGAPGALNTLNELAAALNDDSQAYNTLLALINSNTTAIAGKLDSALTISLIDSAYVAARSSAGSSGLDSAAANSLIDAKIQVIDIGDVVGTDGTSGQILQSLGNGNSTWINAFDSTAVSGMLSGYSGNIVPSADSTYSLGSPTKKWKDLYLSGNTIYFGDSVTLSAQQVQYIPTSVATVVDSASVRALFTSAGDLNYNESTGTFSLTVSSVVDSAYIAARSGAISSVNNNFNPGANQQYSLGDSNNRWKDLYLSDSSIIFGTTATLTAAKINLIPTVLLDSAIIKNTIIDATYIQANQNNYLDSSLATQLINAAYIQANQTTYSTADFVDSAYVTTQINNLIDAAPGALNTLNELAAALGDDANFSTTITNQIAGKLDSSLTTQLIDSSYVQLRQAAPTASQVRAFLVAGSNVTYDSATGVISSTASGGIDSAAANTLIDASIQAIDIDDFTNVSGTNGKFLKSIGNREATWASVIDSSGVIGLIDSAYIQARQADIYRDSAFVTGIVSASYIQSNQTNFLDSSLTTQLINASYIQANQIKYSTADFVDSAYVTTQINNLIDGAPGTLDTLNEIAAAINDDANAYTTLVGLINAMPDSSWITALPISTFSNDANYLDSTTVQGVISSSYIQTNQTTYSTADFPDSAGVITLIAANETTYSTADFPDSAYVTAQLATIDSAYVQLRQAAPTASQVRAFLVAGSNITYDSATGVISSTASGSLDSAGAIALIDSAYVQLRQAAPTASQVRAFLVAGSNITYDSATGVISSTASGGGSGIDSAAANLLIDASIQAIDIDDFTNVSGTNGKFLKSIGNREATWATVIDSSGVIGLIDSAYIQARQADIYRDSAFVTSIVSSAYIQSNQTNFLDSALTTQLISSAYIQSNQTTYSTADFPDSAYVTTQLSTIDSAYVQLRQAAPTAAQVRPFLVAGSNITYDSATGVISSTAGGGSQNLFSTIAVSGQSNIEADATTDTLTFAAGSNITITTDASTDTITIASTASGGGGGTDSAAVINLIDASLQTLDIDDFSTNAGTNDYYLKSTGNREAEWTDLDTEIRQKAFVSALIFS